jgi:hypothetical protein
LISIRTSTSEKKIKNSEFISTFETGLRNVFLDKNKFKDKVEINLSTLNLQIIKKIEENLHYPRET